MADIADLHRYLRCDPEAGKLFWLPRTEDDFTAFFRGPAASQAVRWNGRWAGKEALTAVNNKGYRTGMFLGSSVKAHRVIWAMVNGEWPASDIDHINGDRTDNRLVNLRAVNHVTNGRNQKQRETNTSGVMGVCWNRRAGRWAVRINRDGGRAFLGYFDDFGAATLARREAEVAAGYHPNHGRAA